jgi:hypothetical protein
MRQYLQSGRQVEQAEALEQPKRCDGGVKIEAGGEPGTEGEAEGFDGIHARPS